VLYYYLGDHVLYLVYKLARRDLYHWMPVEGIASVAVAFSERVVVKAITDFTGVIQFRGPGEMGGAGWVCSQSMALVASIVATHIYLRYSDGDAAVTASTAWVIVGGLCGGWILSFIMFLMLMRKRHYWGTFISTQTGHAWAKSRFQEESNAESFRMHIHRFNKKLWTSIRGDVKAYTVENWERWEEETPEWFDDNFRSFVDDDMIPADVLVRMQGGGSRRRSSLGDVLGVRGESKRSTREVVPVQD
jgi:hypothetical protein